MPGLLPSSRQFSFVQNVLRLLTAPFLDWHVTGLANIPAQGPLIVALNHTSFLDVITPALFFPRPLTSFTKVEAFHSPLALLFRWFKMVPIHRGEVDRAALERALKILREGGAFAVAPEGTRTQEGSLIRAKAGVALLAYASRAPVLPMAIWGASRGGFRKSLLKLRRTRIQVVIGPPICLSESAILDRRSRQAIADDLMLHLAELLPPDMLGYYADKTAFPVRYFEPYSSAQAAGTPSATGISGVQVVSKSEMSAGQP